MPQKALRFPKSLIPALLMLTVSVSPLIATPSDDLTFAVRAGGSTSVTEARPEQFLWAFSSVIVRHKERQLTSYISAAVQLRPDLADRIVVAALKVRWLQRTPLGRQLSCDTIGRIIRAAVAAAPSAAVAIVRAAVKTEPYARACIVEAALSVAPDQELAIRQAPGGGDTLVIVQTNGPINPADFLPAGPVNSPEKPPAGP
jgi:hypothetical protein